MENRDLLKDQIEQLGHVLGEILNSFFTNKNSGAINIGIEQTNFKLKNELGIDLYRLLELKNGEIDSEFKLKNLTDMHLLELAILLHEIGLYKLETDKTQGDKYMSKATLFLNLADKYSNSISFQREELKNKIIKASNKK